MLKEKKENEKVVDFCILHDPIDLLGNLRINSS